MKRWRITVTRIIFCVTFACIGGLVVCWNNPTLVWKIMTPMLEREEKEGGHRIGSDTVLYWNDGVFQIGNYGDRNALEFHGSDVMDTVLRRVSEYKKYKEKLYVIAVDGYAVIDKNDNAEVYISVDSLRIDDYRVRYLDEYDDFSQEDQGRFEEMSKK